MGEELAEAIPDFATLEVDRVRVVGRERPATIHALLGDERMAGDPAFMAFGGTHAELLEAYRGRRWDDAQAALAANEQAAAAYGLAKLYARYRASIAACREKPPGDDWDGVTAADSK
jgi:adenylate cyclase